MTQSVNYPLSSYRNMMMVAWRAMMQITVTAPVFTLPVTLAAHGRWCCGSASNTLLRVAHSAPTAPHRRTPPCRPRALQQDPADVREGERTATAAPHLVVLVTSVSSSATRSFSARQFVCFYVKPNPRSLDWYCFGYVVMLSRDVYAGDDDP